MFKLVNNNITIDPNLLPIPEFRELWDRDKDKNKLNAYKELTYIYYFADYKSPYQNIPEELREKKVKEEYIRDDSWKADEAVNEAIKKYQLLQETHSMRLLSSAKIAVDKLSAYFRDSDPNDRNYSANLSKLGATIESIDKLEKRVKSEQSTAEQIRGGGDLRSRER